MDAVDKCTADDINEIGRRTQERIEEEHRLDNVYMLTYTILMAFTVLTIWLFKHRRFRYIHETGLAVIYGILDFSFDLFRSCGRCHIQVWSTRAQLDNSYMCFTSFNQ